MSDIEDTAPQTAETAEPLHTVEHWAEVGVGENCQALKPWQLRAVRAFHRWPIGQEMTATAFAKAVSDALNAVIR